MLRKSLLFLFIYVMIGPALLILFRLMAEIDGTARSILIYVMPPLLFSISFGLFMTFEKSLMKHSAGFFVLFLVNVGVLFKAGWSEDFLMILLLAMKLIVILSLMIMLWNRFFTGRATSGGLINGVVAGALAFSFCVCAAMSYYPKYLGHYPSGIFTRGLSAYWVPVSLLLLTVMFFWRGSLIPLFMRRPRPLPDFKGRRGVTLIELLIVVAIIAIIAPMMIHAVSTASLQISTAKDAREATHLARNEFARLRAADTLPEPGEHELASTELPCKLIVFPEMQEGLVPVRIEIEIGRPFQPRTIGFDGMLIAPEEEKP